MSNSNPSVDPANSNTLYGLLVHFFKKKMSEFDFCTPAKVVSFDRNKNRASIVSQIKMIGTNNEQFSKKSIASVPVYNAGGGGFILSFPLKAGDLGWLIANDSDISLFLNQYNEQIPNTERVHSFSDGFFLPDPMTGYTIAGEDSANVTLQNLSGDVKITLSNNSVKIKTPSNVTIESPQIDLKGNVKVDGTLTVTGETTLEQNLKVEGNSAVDGNELVLGNIASGANITATGTITPGTPP